jgi:hypothetical protein
LCLGGGGVAGMLMLVWQGLCAVQAPAILLVTH